MYACQITKEKSIISRKQHRLYLREKILNAFKELSHNPFYNRKGAMVGELRNIMVKANSSLKVSVNTLDLILKDLIKEGLIIWANPERSRHRKFLIKNQ